MTLSKCVNRVGYVLYMDGEGAVYYWKMSGVLEDTQSYLSVWTSYLLVTLTAVNTQLELFAWMNPQLLNKSQ